MSLRHDLAALPFISEIAKALGRRRFLQPSHYGNWGVYGSPAAARRDLPAGSAEGFDAEVAAHIYNDRLDRVFAYDYPVLFWLRSALRDGSNVFDVGGHIGLAYYAYKTYLAYPVDLGWTVLDLPPIVQAGARLAKERGVAEELRFVTDFAAGDGADIMLAAGSVQCIEEPAFVTLLGRLAKRPRHLIINKLPLHERAGFCTLENIGTGMVVLQVFQRAGFLASLAALGYVLKDAWEVPERRLVIPFHPERTVANYSGLYLVLGS